MKLVLALASILSMAGPALASPEPEASWRLSDREKATALRIENRFQLAKLVTSAPTKAPSSEARAEKNPWVAAALNFLVMGGGYVYNGERLPFGVGLTVAGLGMNVVELGLWNQALNENTNQALTYTMAGSFLLASTMLAIDAYQEAERINAAP